MNIRAIILPSSMLLFSIAVALIVSTISLIYKAKVLELEGVRNKKKKDLAKEIKCMVNVLFIIAVITLISGFFIFQGYVSNSLIVSTDNVTNLMSK